MASYFWYMLGYNEPCGFSIGDAKKKQRMLNVAKSSHEELLEKLEIQVCHIEKHVDRWGEILNELQPILEKRRKSIESYDEETSEEPEAPDECVIEIPEVPCV